MRIKTLTAKTIIALTALATAVAGQVAPLPAPAVAAETARSVSPFGIVSHPMWSMDALGQMTVADIDAELDAIAAAGAKWTRVDIGWRNFEQSKGDYTDGAWFFNRFDYIVAGALRRGINPQVAVFGTPGWANGNAGEWVPPTRDSDYADFMRYMASRYRGRVTHWEIWNEQNLSFFWRPAPDAARYTSLLKAAYTATKQGNPDAVVISGGLCGNDKVFLQKMYDAGAKGYFDLLGVHPYSAGTSPYARFDPQSEYKYRFGGLAEVRKTMEANGDADRHMYVSEAGWSTSVGDPERQGVSEALQAQYITEAYQRVLDEFPYVEVMLIYNLRDKGTDTSNLDKNYGIIRPDFGRKPSYYTFKEAATAWQAPAETQASRLTVSYGGASTINIQLSPAVQTAVRIEQLPARTTTWQEVTTTVTTAEGTVQLNVTPKVTTAYRAVLPDLGITSNTVTIKVRASATIKSSRKVVRPRRYVRLDGRVLLAKNTVVMLQRRVGRSWRNVRRVRTRANGYYKTWLRFTRRGTYTYRIKYYGNSSQLGTYSRPTPLRVR